MQRLHQTTNRNSRTSAWLVALATMCALLGLSAALFAQGSVTVRPADERPSNVLLLIDGNVVVAESLQVQRGLQVMIWIRDLEKLGWGKVEPLQEDRVSFVGKTGVTLTFIKKQDVALVNSLPVKLPINTYTRNGNMMVPLSFVAKALGYEYVMAERPVVSIDTTPTPVSKTSNSIRGKVTYNGAPVIGVTIRAVDRDFNAIKGAVAQTDSEGDYRIEDLPDGTYMAYSYAGDNPTFINRSTKPVSVKGGETGQLAALELVQAITPISPKIGAQVSPNAKGQIAFSWSRCEGATKYRLVIRKPGSDNVIAESTVTKAEAVIPASVLAKGTTYEAQVNALSAGGGFLGSTAGGAGKPWTFSVKAK